MVASGPDHDVHDVDASGVEYDHLVLLNVEAGKR